ncbi:inositol monophosphatase family protein [Psychrobacillus sp. FJAT-51614]|uniref:inositol monophosphatase family protein n=1 Tax=Psychrobacillus mangrovi TaxID=3117745 RepID=UPI003013AAF8
MGKLLNFTENVVRKSGKHIVKMRNESHIDITYKDVGELVTSADFASDQIIREAILYYYPDHRILSEENFTSEGNKERFDGPLWIVDPLDGTVNFAKGLPHFAVLVAFAVDGIVWVGVVHAPEMGITFTGIRGNGSFFNGKKLQVSSISKLSESVVGTGFPHDKSQIKSALTRINNLATSCRDIRRFAAPTIDICYVASGLLDAHTESLKYWDVAAAGLIAREAGATIGHAGKVPDNIPNDLFGEEIICSTPGIFKELFNLLQKND